MSAQTPISYKHYLPRQLQSGPMPSPHTAKSPGDVIIDRDGTFDVLADGQSTARRTAR